jgi:hypothetical protein
MSTKDEEYKAILRSVLSSRVYTPARDFNPKLKGKVPSDRVYDLLKEMQEAEEAELAFGRGWRIIEDQPTDDDPAMVEMDRVWREQVATGLTLLGFHEWVTNEALATGWDPGQDPKGEHPERVDYSRLKWMGR